MTDQGKNIALRAQLNQANARIKELNEYIYSIKRDADVVVVRARADVEGLQQQFIGSRNAENR